MGKHDHMILWMCCLCVIPGNRRSDAHDASPSMGVHTELTVCVGSFRITDRLIEFRCLVENDTGQDVWVYAPDYDRSKGNGASQPYGCELFFLDHNEPTLFLYGCINAKWKARGVWGHQYSTPYVRLRRHETRAMSLSYRLPVPTTVEGEHMFSGARREGAQFITRLVCAVGYYTEDDLRFLCEIAGGQGIDRDDSGEIILVTGSTQSRLVNAEQNVTVTEAQVCIPIKNLLPSQVKSGKSLVHREEDIKRLAQVIFSSRTPQANEFSYAARLFAIDKSLFNDSARQIADVYIQVANGKLPPANVKERLDEILSEPDRARLLEDLEIRQTALDEKAPPLAALQALDDMFYSFSLDLDEYRYGHQLLSINEDLFDDEARQLARVYMDRIDGKSSSSEIARRLDKIASKNHREELLAGLKEKAEERGQELK